jgi:hypothetical protein
MLKRAWQLNPSDFQIGWTLSQICAHDVEKHAFSMAAAAAGPNSPFARKMTLTAPTPHEKLSVLSKYQFMTKGEKPPEWKFPHLVIESAIGVKVYLGPTLYDPLTEDDVTKLYSIMNDLRWAIQLNPSSVELRENFAKCLVCLSRYDDTMKECDAIKKLNSRLHPADVIASELYGMGQLRRAKEVIEDKFKNDHDPAGVGTELHVSLAAISTEQGNRTQAFAGFRDAFLHLERSKNGEQAWNISGRWLKPMECSGTFEQVNAA